MSKEIRTMRNLKRALAISALTVVSMVAAASPATAAPGIQTFEAFTASTDAGAHADATTRVIVNGTSDFQADGRAVKSVIDLPPGAVGFPLNYPACPQSTIGANPNGRQLYQACGAATQVGVWHVRAVTEAPGFAPINAATDGAVINVEETPNTPGRFLLAPADGFFPKVFLSVSADTTTDDHIVATVPEINQEANLKDVVVTLWGNPGAHARGGSMCNNKVGSFLFPELLGSCAGEATTPVAILPPLPVSQQKAFMRNPTACDGPKTTDIEVNFAQDQSLAYTKSTTAPTPTSCQNVPFNPTISADPTAISSGEASGMHVDLAVPQSDDPNTIGTSDLKDAVVTLPEGMTVNPSAADGIEGCTPAQLGRHTNDEPTCPDSSQVGTVELNTPLLLDKPKGAVYLAKPYENPDNSLVELYLVAHSHGLYIKLPGKVDLDPVTGQLKTTFANNPQLPFDDLLLDFKSGLRGLLSMPETCGTFTTTTSLAPWSGNPAKAPSSSFTIANGPNDTPCAPTLANRPFDLGFNAGTVDPAAGVKTPFTLKLTREDGEQEIKSLNVTTPPGVTASLKGIPYCSESAIAAAGGKKGKEELANPSCPAASQVGTVTTSAGAGVHPLFVTGKAYLAGAYKGAPMSLVTITPAQAGPYDIGTVVVRAGIYVDPTTAQITVKSDEFPTILEGIQLRVRSVAVHMDRSDFTINPTSCEQAVIGAEVIGTSGAVDKPTQRFQVAGCSNLPFKPSLAFKLTGGTNRGDYPALTATLKARPGDANIARTAVALPHAEFLAQNHIKTICTRVQFAANQCPEGSIYGYAKAVSPLLDKPLEGPVYLRSSSNPLPDLVASLDGQFKIVLAGRIDSVHGGIRNTFDVIPDAPVTEFTLSMKGGKKSLLVNSKNLCKGKPSRANVKLAAQNGKALELTPKVVNDCAKKAKPTKRHERPVRAEIAAVLAAIFS
jgi:hypothetical protein